jgi:hypothetical protein
LITDFSCFSFLEMMKRSVVIDHLSCKQLILTEIFIGITIDGIVFIGVNEDGFFSLNNTRQIVLVPSPSYPV